MPGLRSAGAFHTHADEQHVIWERPCGLQSLHEAIEQAVRNRQERLENLRRHDHRHRCDRRGWLRCRRRGQRLVPIPVQAVLAAALVGVRSGVDTARRQQRGESHRERDVELAALPQAEFRPPACWPTSRSMSATSRHRCGGLAARLRDPAGRQWRPQGSLVSLVGNQLNMRVGPSRRAADWAPTHCPVLDGTASAGEISVRSPGLAYPASLGTRGRCWRDPTVAQVPPPGGRVVHLELARPSGTPADAWAPPRGAAPGSAHGDGQQFDGGSASVLARGRNGHEVPQ